MIFSENRLRQLVPSEDAIDRNGKRFSEKIGVSRPPTRAFTPV